MWSHRLRAAIVVAVIASLVTAFGALALLLVNSPTLRYEVAITTSGTPVVGMDFSIRVNVKDRSPSTSRCAFTFLTVPGMNDYEVVSQNAMDNPWRLVGTLNLTGIDLADGRTFGVDTTPIWAASQRLEAYVWCPRGELSTVRLQGNPPIIDLNSVDVKGFAFTSITTEWPVHETASASGNLSVTGNVTLSTLVQGQVSGPRAPALLFLSLELKIYYRALSANGDNDPWLLANVWNLTGLDLSRGVEFKLDASPSKCGPGIPLEARVWAPRGGWSEVVFDSSGGIQNLESVFLWGSQTVDFPIAC